MSPDGVQRVAARMTDRVLASVWDYLVVLAILAIGAAMAWVSNGPATVSVGQTDALVLAASVAPTWLYLTATCSCSAGDSR